MNIIPHGSTALFFFSAPSSFLRHGAIRVILSLLYDAMALTAPGEGIAAAFILLEGDIYVVLGGDVPLILPISEEIRVGESTFSASCPKTRDIKKTL